MSPISGLKSAAELEGSSFGLEKFRYLPTCLHGILNLQPLVTPIEEGSAKIVGTTMCPSCQPTIPHDRAYSVGYNHTTGFVFTAKGYIF